MEVDVPQSAPCSPSLLLYLRGDRRGDFSLYGIAAYMDEQGLLVRGYQTNAVGSPWRGNARLHTALRQHLIEKDHVSSKNYLKLLVAEIRYKNRRLIMKGSYAALVRVAGERKKGTPRGEVPTFCLDWLPGQDSNLRPAG